MDATTCGSRWQPKRDARVWCSCPIEGRKSTLQAPTVLPANAEAVSLALTRRAPVCLTGRVQVAVRLAGRQGEAGAQDALGAP